MSAPELGAGAPVLAFDVGGTDTKAALIEESGRLIEVARIATPRDPVHPATAVLTEVGRLAAQFTAAHPGTLPRAAGLLVPGHVDDAAGIGIHSENLGWRNVRFRDRAEALLGLPVAFGHDVRGAGYAEQRLGAAAPYRDVLVVAIGTGIAAAVFIGGELYLGDGLAGELGHARVADGPVCACGGTGCLEAVASAAAIARDYSARSGSRVSGAAEVLARMRAGDRAARLVWEGALDALSLGLSHAVALLSPEAIVIGGGLSEAGSDLFDPLRERLETRLTFHRRPLLVRAVIGGDAGLIGAALQARDLAAAGNAS